MDNANENYDYIDERIKHLSSDHIKTLIERYYNGENVKNLIQEYKIEADSSGLYKIFPPIVNEDILCPYCHVPMLSYWNSRSSQENPTPQCEKCGHRNIDNCRCRNCVEERKKRAIEEDNLRRNKIESVYDLAQLKPVNECDISFKQRIYIGALLRAGMTEDYSVISPYASYQIPFAPTGENELKIIKYLIDKNILKVHPSSALDSFDINNDFPYRFYPAKVKYYLNVVPSLDRKAMINNFINPTNIEISIDDAYELWKEINIDECIEYLLYSMCKVGFDFTPGEKTYDTFRDLLDNFSVSQIYSIIYSSISKATRYYQERNIPKKQAVNSVITFCKSYGERIVAENWEKKGFGKVYDIPQSVLSEFYFNRILKIGEKGFYEKPNMVTVISCMNATETEITKTNKKDAEDTKQQIEELLNKNNDCIKWYRINFCVSNSINIEIPNPCKTHVKASNENEAIKLAIDMISKAFGVQKEDINITEVVIDKN